MEEARVFRQFNVSVFLHFLGRHLYAIFVPFLLLENGYSLTTVLLFLLFSSIVTLFAVQVSVRYLAFKKIFYFNFLSSLAELAFIILLFSHSSGKFILPLLVLCEGLYYAFYYISYRSIIIYKSSGAQMVHNVVNLEIANNISAIVAPLVGASLLMLGKSYLLAAAATFVIISIIPLKIILNESVPLSSGRSFHFDRRKGMLLLYYGLLGGIEMSLFTLWAITAFLNDYSPFLVSFIPISTTLVSIVLLKLIKNKISNPRSAFVLIMTGASLILFVSFWRFLTPLYFGISNLLASLGFLLLLIPGQVRLYNILRENNIYEAAGLIESVMFVCMIFVVVGALAFGLKAAIMFPAVIAPVMVWLGFKIVYVRN